MLIAKSVWSGYKNYFLQERQEYVQKKRVTKISTSKEDVKLLVYNIIHWSVGPARVISKQF